MHKYTRDWEASGCAKWNAKEMNVFGLIHLCGVVGRSYKNEWPSSTSHCHCQCSLYSNISAEGCWTGDLLTPDSLIDWWWWWGWRWHASWRHRREWLAWWVTGVNADVSSTQDCHLQGAEMDMQHVPIMLGSHPYQCSGCHHTVQCGTSEQVTELEPLGPAGEGHIVTEWWQNTAELFGSCKTLGFVWLAMNCNILLSDGRHFCHFLLCHRRGQLMFFRIPSLATPLDRK